MRNWAFPSFIVCTDAARKRKKSHQKAASQMGLALAAKNPVFLISPTPSYCMAEG